MGGNFDGYWLFKYLTENILTDVYFLSPYNCKHSTVFKQFDGLNFDGLAGMCQNIKILHYTVMELFTLGITKGASVIIQHY